MSKICLPLTLLLKPPLHFFLSPKIHNKVTFCKIPSEQYQSDIFPPFLWWQGEERQTALSVWLVLIERITTVMWNLKSIWVWPCILCFYYCIPVVMERMLLDARSQTVINGDHIVDGSVALWCDGGAHFELRGWWIQVKPKNSTVADAHPQWI